MLNYWFSKPTPTYMFGVTVFQVLLLRDAAVAQLVEHVLGKDEAMGSNPISSSRKLLVF